MTTNKTSIQRGNGSLSKRVMAALTCASPALGSRSSAQAAGETYNIDPVHWGRRFR